MIESSEIMRFFLYALIIGIFIGVEREFSKRKYRTHSIGGVRTFILLAIFGALSGYFSVYFENLLFLLIPFLIVAVWALLNYYYTLTRFKETHTTTGICTILVFVLSFMVFYGFGKFAIALSILIAVLLSSRIYLHRFIQKITKKELKDIWKFAIISLVILPFLPNKAYGPLGVLNPYVIWLMVVFVSAISFVGYIFVKVLGPSKGIGITGLVGGLASSTAVTMTFSEKSKKINGKLTNVFALAIIVASNTMFLRILFEVLVLNRELLSALIAPLGLMSITGALFSYYYLKINKTEKSENLKLKSPFALGPAIKFGVFFALILIISKAAQIYLGTKGIYLTSILSGLADVDAITLSMAKLSAENAITNNVASSAITLAALANTVFKGGIVYFWGSKELKKKILFSFGVIILIGLLSIWFF